MNPTTLINELLKDLTVTDDDLKWMKLLYEKIRNQIKPTYRQLRSELRNSISQNYDPRNIDPSLATYKGTELTILGIEYLDPQYKIFEKVNRLMTEIQGRLLADHSLARVESKDLALSLKIDEAEVSFLLTLINPYGRFWTSASGSPAYYGYSSIGLDDGNDTIFEQYLNFTSIESLIVEKAERDKNDKQKKYNTAVTQNEGHDTKEESGFRYHPIFSSVITKKNHSLCFVLMPFTQPWSDTVYKKIRDLIESLGLQCLRADNLTGSIIIEDIWIQINQAAFIIADVTGRNPNVMYELGIAHTVGTPVILLTQELDFIPFDFKHLRHTHYSNTLDGWNKAEDEIRKTIEALRSR